IRLTTHNNQAQRINDRELASLPGKAYSFRAEVKDDFPEYSYPADEVLTIKEGAQIMFLKNDVSSEKRYYNGMIGEVVTVNETGMFVRGKDSEHEFQLLQEEWGNYKYVLNEETKEITEEIAGVFRQYPIRLAWAITIHKSQGLTFERAIIDARNSFAHGQTYVALSRCKTLDGMVLESPLRREAIISDSVVDNFTKAVERNKPGNKQLNDMQKAYFFDLLSDLFNFYSIEQAYKRLLRMMDEDLYRLFPKQLAEYKALEPHMKERIVEVARRFRNQYTRLINESEDYAGNQELQERIRSGAGYFRKELEPVRALFDKTNMPLDNRELRKQLNERLQTLDDALCIKESLLDTVCTSTFTVSDYLKQKAKVMLSLEEDSSTSASSSRVPGEKRERKERAASSRSGKVKVDVPTDILHPELYRALAEWRTEKTREANVPAYVIMQQKALMGIVNLLPDTPAALEAIPYFGTKGVEKYGLEILGIVRKYMKENQVERPEVKEIFISAKEHKKDKKKEEKKELKKDTKIVSYEMFCQGMSIEEIAKARDLVTGTIAGHLEQYVRSGKIKVEQVVKAENLAKIRKYLEEHEYMGMFAIKAALGDDVSYADIKFALVASGLVRPS
ncbi:helix-turn-helix domain-containing protein, partial [Bacteroides acidifaciens]